MSLESFKTGSSETEESKQEEEPESSEISTDSEKVQQTLEDDSSDNSIVAHNWHIKPEGVSHELNSTFYNEDTPNDPPLMHVSDKLAADMELIHDDAFATEVAESYGFSYSDRVNLVIKVKFNDFSTWHWPTLHTQDNTSEELIDYIETYVDEIVRWRAIVKGEDPDEALRTTDLPWNRKKDSWHDEWLELMEETGLTHKERLFFNELLSWPMHMLKKVESEGDKIQLDEDENDDWLDDW